MFNLNTYIYMEIVVFLLCAFIAVLLLIYVLGSVYRLAKRLGYSPGIHVLIGIFLTPFVPIIYLYCAGETDAHRKARIEEEERWRRDVI